MTPDSMLPESTTPDGLTPDGVTPDGVALGVTPGATHADTICALSEWLLQEGRFLPDNAEMLAELCERLVAAGLPLDRVSLHLRALHPRYRGVSRVWKPATPIEEL